YPDFRLQLRLANNIHAPVTLKSSLSRQVLIAGGQSNKLTAARRNLVRQINSTSTILLLLTCSSIALAQTDRAELFSWRKPACENLSSTPTTVPLLLTHSEKGARCRSS